MQLLVTLPPLLLPLGMHACSLDTWDLALTFERPATASLGTFPGFARESHFPQRTELGNLTSAIQLFFLYLIVYILLYLSNYLTFP